MIEPREYTEKDRRVFGLVLGGLLLTVAVLQARKGRPYWWVPAMIGSASALLGAVLPRLLTPVLAVWMRFAGVMAAINTCVLMGIIYFFVIAPFGLYKRLRRQDPLDEYPSIGEESYWQPHARRAGSDDYKLLF